MADGSYKRIFVRQVLLRPGRVFVLSLFICVAVMGFTTNIFSMTKSCQVPVCRCKNEVQNSDIDEDDLYQLDLEKERKLVVTPKLTSFLFVAILTGPNNADRRKVMRETWLSRARKLEKKVLFRFVIGTANLTSAAITTLSKEDSRYGDLLLLGDFEDAYKKLTYKVLKTFEWIANHVDTQFVFKCDDDTFARLDAILSDLKSKAQSKLYWGFMRGDSRVKRGGPWAEPNWKLCDHYLPYAMGGGYVLSSDLVQYIANNGPLLQKFNSEDVSVGAWLSPLQLHREHDVRFDTEYKSRGCNNRHIVSHKQSMNDMYTKQLSLRTIKTLCTEETEDRMSFIYDWNMPPSKCCKRKSGIP